ncbi:MAG: M1 family metallopeptidase, partial [Planctomycetota bacterium]
MRTPILAAALLLGASASAAQEAPSGTPPSITHHDLDVQIDPATGGISVRDSMTIARNGGGMLSFRLRSGLKIGGLSVEGEALETIARTPGPHGRMDTVQVPVSRGSTTARVDLTYSGTIREEVRKAETTSFVVGDHSRGTIGPQGVFLSGATGWTADDGGLATYAVSATVPDGWSVCTQGGVPTSEGTKAGTRFVFPAGIPVDSLWLQAGQWTVERRTIGGISIGTYLSKRNAGVSKVMIDSIGEYLDMYEKVLGKYPHAKFDIVENFFTSGYGMPTATLLGPMVIARIGMVSQRGGKVPPGYLDHELVHCWWGNGVFVDYKTGNWCEALTTYCSNYLRKEWDSLEEAKKHRASTRARFATRVSPEKDYPLRRFTGKQEDFENDIGYGKGSMLFHAVRRAIGDEAFFGALRDVVAEFTGRRATWSDLQAAFEKRGGRRLGPVMNAFLDQTGAPLLRLENVVVASAKSGWTVNGEIAQDGKPWPLAVPLVLETLQGETSQTIDVVDGRTAFSLHSDSLPLRLLMDPDSQVFRGFAAGEVPPTLNRWIEDGARRLLVTPADPDVMTPYQPLLGRLRGEIERADSAAETPRSLFVLGHPDRSPAMKAALSLEGCPVSVRGTTVTAGGRRFE